MIRLSWAIVVALILALYGRPLVSLAQRWWFDADYSHGFLVAAICIFMGIRCWRKTEGGRGTFLGLALFLPGLALYAAGTAGAEIFSITVSLLFVLAGTILLLSGKRKGLCLLFPIGFFIFAIPLPEVLYFTLTSPLQTLAARIGAGMAGLMGLMVSREGNIVHVGEISLGVAEACSGLRSLVAYCAISVLLAKFVQKAWAQRITLIVCAVLVAVASNAVRLFLTAVGSVARGVEFSTGTLHAVVGGITFAGGVVVLLLISELLRWRQRSSQQY